MKAETVFNVFVELPESEKKRCLRMCQKLVQESTKPNKPKKKTLITDEEVTEFLLAKLKPRK